MFLSVDVIGNFVECGKELAKGEIPKPRFYLGRNTMRSHWDEILQALAQGAEEESNGKRTVREIPMAKLAEGQGSPVFAVALCQADTPQEVLDNVGPGISVFHVLQNRIAGARKELN